MKLKYPTEQELSDKNGIYSTNKELQDKLKQERESDLEDNFGRDILKLPKDYAESIRNKVVKSTTDNFFYRLVSDPFDKSNKKYGTTYNIIQDTIYTPLTPIKSIYQMIEEAEGDEKTKRKEKWQEMIDRNKNRSLSKLKEIYKGVRNGEIRFLDLDQEGTEKILKRIKDLMAVIVYDNKYGAGFTKIYETLRQNYQKFRKKKDFYPEEKLKDARTLIDML